ncbi:MAG: RNA polymerase sigma factor [Bacteroidetes bacterium]|nr:RNA polymerase sigma factor [Bacteroidota bacterium]
MNYNDYSDDELVEGALGNKRLFQEMLYRKYADAMYTVACNYSDNDDEAADILQEGFIKVFRNLASHDRTRSLGGWIRRIVVNTALENYRKKVRHLEVVDEFAKEEADTSVDYLNEVEPVDIVKYVNELPAKARMVLKLYSLEGYGHQEISSALNISVGTSKSQLNRAKTLLRSMIQTAKNG